MGAGKGQDRRGDLEMFAIACRCYDGSDKEESPADSELRPARAFRKLSHAFYSFTLRSGLKSLAT